jgi:hypothetical protein
LPGVILVQFIRLPLFWHKMNVLNKVVFGAILKRKNELAAFKDIKACLLKLGPASQADSYNDKITVLRFQPLANFCVAISAVRP